MWENEEAEDKEVRLLLLCFIMQCFFMANKTKYSASNGRSACWTRSES